MAGPSRKSAISPESTHHSVLSTSVHPGTALWVVLALLMVLELDLAAGFALLSVWHLSAALALSLLLGLSLRSLPRRDRLSHSVLVAGTILGVFLAALAVSHQFAARRILATYETASSGRLDRRARDVEHDFQAFLRDLSRPALQLAQLLPPERTGRFAWLQDYASRHRPAAERYGWTLWHNGMPESWAGRTVLGEGGNPPTGQVEFSVVAQGASVLLVASSSLREGWVLTGEYLLQSPLEPVPGLPLPSLRIGSEGDTLRLGSLPTLVSPGAAPDLEFSRAGRARHGGTVSIPTLYLPLKDSSGQTLVLATLRDRSVEAVILANRSWHQLAGITVSCLGLLILGGISFRFAFSSSGTMAVLPFAAGVGFLGAA